MLSSKLPSVVPLRCQPMTYAWGKKGSSSAVARLANLNIDETINYAELWMGAHPNAPSIIELPYTDNDKNTSAKSKTLPLSEMLHDYINQYLPPAIRHFNNNELPFLFKVLSIHSALSIQAHPDKSLASQLHKDRPSIYRDANHKPEMAVALTNFESLFGFRPLKEIVDNLGNYPELKTVVGKDAADTFVNAVVVNDNTHFKSCLRILFTALMSANESLVNSQITALVTRLQHTTDQNEIDQLILRLNKQYPNDVGVLCVLMMNYVKMAPGEALYMGANVLHAYISGDCMECMSSSDNVVRAGLTPKLKDVPTLINMLTYDYGPAKASIFRPSPYRTETKIDSTSTVVYDPPIPEFTILCTRLETSTTSSNHGPTNVATEHIDGIRGPSILICTHGKGSLCILDDNAKGQSPDSTWRLKFDLIEGTVLFIAPDVKVEMATSQTLTVYRAYCDGHE